MGISLDFSNVAKREPLAEGTYSITIDKAVEKISSTGNPMLSVEFLVEGHEGTRLFDNFPFAEKALWKIQGVLSKLGYDVETSLDFEASDLIGGQLDAKVIQETYDGRIVNRVDSYV